MPPTSDRHRPFAPTRSWLALACVAAFLLSSCTRFKTVRECRELAQTVNPALTMIRAAIDAPPTAEGYEAIATEYDGILEQLSGRSFTRPDLAKAASDYAELLADAARDSRAYAEALRKRDSRHLARARTLAQKKQKKEKAIISRIGKFCRGP